jgi:hypothetical protein
MGFLSSLAAAVLDPSKEKTNRWKGAKGEAQAASGMFLFLPSGYTVMNDIMLPTPKGTTQIDHVVVSNYGIFVVESKNIAGAVYGSEGDEHWTVCRGPAKFTIFNPLRQNAAHIKALAAATGLPENLFHSLVFFWSDDCSFKTPMPDNVRRTGLCAYIRSKRRYLMANGDVEAAIKRIEASRVPSTKANEEAHAANLKRRFHTAHAAGAPCPRCGGDLVERLGGRSKTAFLGCSNFPTCRHTEALRSPDSGRTNG